MSDLVFACPTIPTVIGSEVRFSVATQKVRKISDWPLHYQSCEEITPAQTRLQWGLPTEGARLDSYKGLRLGNQEYNLSLGARSTDVGSRSWLAQAERQRVGVLGLTLGGMIRMRYWNDHFFWWWPMGDGGDQGDTAGLQLSYNLARHHVSWPSGWMLNDFSVTMRLASGIPGRASAVRTSEGLVYTDVKFKGIDRGDLNLNTSLVRGEAQRLDIGININSGALRHTVQSDLVHRSMGIPEFPRTRHFGAIVYVRLSNW